MNFFHCHENECSKSLEPKSKYISNFSLRKALCFVFVLFCCLGMWGQTVVEYRSVSSTDTLDWHNPNSWEGGTVPDIDGDEEVYIYCFANLESSRDLTFNSRKNNKIHLYLNGFSLDLSKPGKEKAFILVGASNTDSRLGNVYVNGPGEVKVHTFDSSSNKGHTTDPHCIYLNNGVKFYITNSLYADKTYVKIIGDDKNSELFLTASGANVNYGESGIVYEKIKPKPFGKPNIYTVTDMGGNPFGDEKKIVFERTGVLDANFEEINFEYTITKEGEPEWLFNEADDDSGSVKIASDKLINDEVTLKISNFEDLQAGEGIIITIKTPDGSMNLAEIRCIKDEILWTGGSEDGDEFNDTKNWIKTGSDSDSVTEDELSGNLIIPSGCTKYPNISSEITVKQLDIRNNAELTVDANGNLNVEKLILSGLGEIDATNGTVTFTGSGNTETPSFVAETPELSKFGSLVVAENTEFYTNSDLHITTRLTNNGTFTAGKVYFEPNGDTATITGINSDSLDVAEKTNISELICTSQKGKTLVINGTISVGKIALSGVANEDNSRLTVKSGDNLGIIYLGEACENARFLEFVDNSVEIETNKITVSEWDISNVTDIDNILKRNWVLTDLEEVHVWKGTVDTEWNTLKNWNYWGVPNPDEEKSVRIPSGCTNYPIIKSDEVIKINEIECEGSIEISGGTIEASKLSLKNAGSITVVSDGKIILNESLNIEDLSKIDAANGTVTFTGSGSAENPSFVANKPELSKFGSLVVAENANFYTASDLYVANLTVEARTEFVAKSLNVTKSLEINGKFSATDVSIKPSEDTFKINSSNSGNISFEKLSCVQGGKTLVINGTISVGEIALSGVANEDNSRLTVKTENQGTINLSQDCDASYLSFEKGKIVTIQNKFIKVSNSYMDDLKADSDFKSEFVEKNWRYADQTEFIWTGKNDGKWKDSKNWDFYSVPSDNAQSIIIPNGCVNYPILDENINLRNSSLVIETGASIDFAGSTVNAVSITNNGTVKLTGNETFKKQDDTKTSLNNGEASTVIYYGTNENAEFVWGGSYEKLVIEDGFSGEMHGQDFGISDSLAFGENKPISQKVNDAEDIFSLAGSSLTISYKKGKFINIYATGNHRYNGNLAFSETVTIESTEGTVSFLGTENTFANGLTLNAPNSYFSNNGKFSSGDAISITAKTFENAEGKTISAKTGFTCEITDTFTNAGTITAGTGDISIKSANFENAQSSELSANTGKITISATGDFSNSGKIDSSSELLKITAKSITTFGEIKANSGEFISTESDILFGENSETSFEAGLVVTSAANFENDGSITAYGVEIDSTGNFTNSGKIDSSSELLKIIAKSITTFGEIKANSGEFISTESDILFAENSETTFEAGLTITSAGNFENYGAITAFGVEIVAIGNFKNEGSFISENGDINITSANFENVQSSEISANTGKMTITATSDFTNAGTITASEVEIGATGDFTNSRKLISENGDINITSASFENAQSSEISANSGKITISATSDFINAGNITAYEVEIEAIGNFTNSGSFISENGDITITSASFENAQSSEFSANTGKITISATSDFSNSGTITAAGNLVINQVVNFTNTGNITASGVEIVATGNFTNSGSFISENGDIIITSANFENSQSSELSANTGKMTISATGDFTNSGTISSSGKLLVNSVINFTNTSNITAYGVEIVATGNFTNSGKLISENGDINITSSNFENAQSSELSANTGKMTISATSDFTNAGTITASGVEIDATGDFTNSGNIDSSSELLKITAKSITTSGEIKAQSGEFISTESDILFAENSETTFEAGLVVNSATNFENCGTITALGVEIEATGNFKNEGSFISENGDISIISANFENAQSSEISANSGKITISATSDFTNAGTITAAGTLVINPVINFTNTDNISASGVEIVATGDFTNSGNFISENGEISITSASFENSQSSELSANTGKIAISATGDFTNAGKIESSSELLKITAKSITTSGEIKANSGEFISTESDILFAENSETTFEAGLTVTSAGNFENYGAITAYGVEIVAIGNFKNSGKIDSSSELLKIIAKSITTSGEINAQSGDFESTEAGIVFAANSENTFEAGLTVTSAGNFENYGAITAFGVGIDSTGDFSNSGKIDSSTGLLKITAKSITTSGEIKANSGEFISTESDILFGEDSENTFEAGLTVSSAANFKNDGSITAYGVEIEATGDFTNSGSFISENGDINIKSANFENAQSSELSANTGKITISATGDFTNAGTITAVGNLVVNQVENFTNSCNITALGVEIGATGDFTNSGKIDSSSELLKITAKSITTSGEIKANSGEFISTESDILFGENSENTFEAGLTVSSAANFENDGSITASGVEIEATGNFKNEGSFTSKNGEISITSASFENTQSSEISANSEKITITATGDFTNKGAITAAGKLVINQVVNFTNTDNITVLGVEIVATGDFTNSGNFISENGEISITSASFENAQSSEISANSGKMTISATGDFTNAGAITAAGKLVINQVETFTNSCNITALGVEIEATGDFTNAGTIDSSTGLLKITAKSITTSGKIKANSGEFISTETDILFTENSETSFEAGLTVTSAGNFENSGTITASEVEIVATGDFKNEGNLISENGDISITSANFENASLSELSANKNFVCNVTESFSNAGIITSASGKVDINTKSFINKNYNLETPAKIKTENGLINVTTSNFENSSDISAYLDFTCAEPEIFTNAGTITSETGKIDVKAQIMENPGSLFAINGKIDIFTELFETTKEIFGKNIDINSQSSIFAGLVKSGAGDIYISSDLLITHPVEFCLGGSLIIGTVENQKNLVISSLDKNQNATEVKFSQNDDLESIETKVIVSGYAIIFNGNVTLSTNIDIANDFVLLNGITSGEDSIYRDSITEIDGLFAYNLFERGDFDFIDFPSDLPFSIEDNKLTTKTLSHEKYNTHFSIAEGKIISVDKNFYCNGVDLGLNTSAEWFLKIPGNDVATSAFAECYNASIKNCKVVANTNSEDYAWLSTENVKDETGNTNVAFSKAVLSSTEVSTISDNIIFIKFIDELNGKEIKIENSCNEISAWLENFRFNVSGQISEDNPGIQFTGVYAKPECTESTDGKGDLSTFYLKYEIPTDGSIDYRWNTDAIGNSYGSEESTDSSGNYKKVIPNIAFERALTASYAGLRDEHKNRLVSVGTDDIGSNPLFTETKDKASPVLIAVTLGQEQHETDASSQHHYDSHNFIDWQFSEPVEFENYPKNGISQIDSVDTSANSENIQATATFGKITNQGNGFVVAGLGSFSSGKITTGSKTGLGEVNAFYRNFALDVDEKGSSYNPKIKPTRLRLSIAGYVEEENPINYKGEIYNNWLGFIDSKNTTIPSGTFTMPSSISTSIIDKRGNRGEAMEQTVVVNDFLNRYDKEKTLYGTWDIDSPVVSSYMKENLTTIEFEEVIPVDFSQSLSAQGLEIHFLDNSSYNQFEGYSNWKWRTKIGWLNKNESTEITLPLDNKGGSRMTFAENKTGGGLRLSSIVDSIEALSCKNLDLEKAMTFTTDFSQSTTYEAFFGKSEDLAFDVPYLSLRFSELSKEFSLNNNYELLYSRHDSQGNPIGFITDLAGNLLYDFTVNSPDKNPPKIFLSIGAVHKDKLYIMFSKKLDWKDSNGNADEGKLRRIVKSLSIFDSKGNDTGLIDYKKGSRTKIVTETEKSTGIEISLTRTISYEELKNLYIGVNVFDSRDELIAGDGDKSKEDSISGEHGNFSMLYDLYENPASKDLKHCLSDFAVNALDVLYAYDGRVADEAILAQGVYGGNQWTVTNFTENKDNSSQIISDKDISIVSKIKDPSSFEKQDKFSMIADISPNLQSTGSDFKIYTNINPRLWFTDYIKFFSTEPNNSENIEKDNIGSISGKIENIVSGDKNQNITFVLPNHPKNENSLGWGAGNEIQFLFKVFDKDGNPLMVDGNQDGDFEDDVDHPLFAVRLKDENDLTSIDLWSLNIVDILRQKGGVTILNNVINPLNSEECAIAITIPKAGNLTVQVLTLDGNVVKVIQRGRVEEGTYYYKWNGKNISGDSVARGMYFIRVVGPNIEETRKVMVVW